MKFEKLDFFPLTKEDIPVLTPIMKRAFDNDAELFFGKPEGGPPGYDDGTFLERWAFHPDATAYRIELDGTPLGAVILFICEEKSHGHLGCIFIDSGKIGQGYGAMTWRFVESHYPHIKMWTVETPAVSYRNHCFYINKCGFHVVAVEGGKDRFEAQFKLRKVIEP